jgi:hypothetical protein
MCNAAGGNSGADVIGIVFAIWSDAETYSNRYNEEDFFKHIRTKLGEHFPSKRFTIQRDYSCIIARAKTFKWWEESVTIQTCKIKLL